MLDAILEEQSESMLSVSQSSNPPAATKLPSSQKQPLNSKLLQHKDAKGKMPVTKATKLTTSGASMGSSPKKKPGANADKKNDLLGKRTEVDELRSQVKMQKEANKSKAQQLKRMVIASIFLTFLLAVSTFFCSKPFA